MKKLQAACIGAALLLACALLIAPPAHAQAGSDWKSWGFDTSNTRYNPTEKTIGVGNVKRLAVKWKLPTAGNVSATPAVENGVVYVPDFAGNLYAVNANTGAVIWQANVATMTGIPGDFSRATPAISGNVLILGDQAGKAFSPDGYVLGVDKRNGSLLWKTKVAGGYPIMTQSATVVDGVAYIGAASYEEALVRFGFPLTFRGFMMAMNPATGQIIWKTYMVPEGYTGGSVWGSAPAVDSKRGSLYIATGNNYSMPDEVSECVINAADDAARAACVPAANMFDAIVSLDKNTGAVKWSTRAMVADNWNLACGIPGVPGFEDPTPECPDGAGPDFDFGQAPALFQVKGKEYVGAGQKSGMYWALDPATGALRWKTQAGTGGVGGGLQWGSATDGSRVYTANSNSQFKPWPLENGTTINYGGWSALDAGTGAIKWQRPNPAFNGAPGPVSVANGVMYGCSGDADGHMYALKASDGTVLWDFTSGDACYGGASIVNGVVYWGTGYSLGGPEVPGQALYAFSVQ